ncbi:hypothetical protein MIMGU_mgv1a019519mg [Erythranthe guttata]|uniref:Disease resistance protein RGA3 n=1 Tax=Erythranthe guttata TaxID=4155 RepID=A0A022Q803_ERYGU|nr:hypothetical protein MIMGU_mgv1a019519mg [Erythranthe guttata]
MAEAFLQIVLGKLSTLVEEEIGRITGVGEEMKKLSSTLTTIQAVVEDAEMKQIESKAVQNWLLKLNDLIYEIDDILDEYATEISKLKQKNRRFGRYKPMQLLFRRKIGTRMNEVLEKLDAVAAERAKFHLREMAFLERPTEVAAAASARETGSILNKSQVYGREEDTAKVVDILVNQVNDNEEISILPVIGVGGLGKTTFAQLVYNDERVVRHFEKRIWVCVSDNFDVKTLLKAMIESWSSESASDLVHLDTLQRRLWGVLNNKRYLLVLDDVWNEDQERWCELKKVVACGSTGSSIIVTTRLKKVADIMRTLPSHQLTGLSDENCWMLMRERAFGQEREEYPNLEAIGKKIANKCAGVPLAAKALGGLLRFKRDEKEWNYVKESEIWELPEEETLILPALRLSYRHLPLALRPCFAYCAVFPKDSRIEKRELIFMWMAHGYISSRGALEVEDVGNEVCNELVLRSLLHYVPNPVTKKLDLIMHDLLHDLALSIMENKIPGRQVQRTMGNLIHLRHLNFSGTEICSLPESLCSLWNLHVLNLDSCKNLEALPKKTRYLVNLRHLFLEDCDSLREMPSKIRELTNLVTLSQFVVGGVGRGDELEELQRSNLGGKLKLSHLERVKNPMDAKKANLAEKTNLLHLKLHWLWESMEEDIAIDEKVLEALEPHPNLETLDIKGFRGRCFPVWISSCSSLTLPPLSTFFKKLKILNCGILLAASLSKADLRNLTYLSVDFEENSVETCTITVEALQSLTNLKLLGICRAYANGLSLPEQGLQHLTALEELHIFKCRELEELPPEGFKHLSCLRKVYLRYLPKMVSVPKALRHLSSSLEYLSLTGLPQLSSLPDWLVDLTSLLTLGIYKCPNVASVPASIRGMTNLRCLTVRECPELERRCERETGADWHKISHIPHLQIGEQ